MLLKPYGFSDILFANKLPKAITLSETEYHCEAIELAARRIKLALYPYGYNAYAALFIFYCFIFPITVKMINTKRLTSTTAGPVCKLNKQAAKKPIAKHKTETAAEVITTDL